MSLVPRWYSSSDPSAPVLTGQAGSLASLLDAILVDGYGTGEDERLGAGWTREFSGSNKRAYRNSPITGTGAFLRVDDNATSPGNARHAWVRAFENMSDIDTGVGPCPTVAQETNGALWVKSSALSATARPWCALACEKFLILFVDALGNGFPAAIFGGDLDTIKPGDVFNFALSTSGTSSYTGGNNENASMFMVFATGGITLAPPQNRMYLLRAAGGAPGAVACSCLPNAVQSSGPGSGGFSYPDPIGGGLFTERIGVHEGSYALRGFLPSVLCPLHLTPFNDLEVVSDLSEYPGVDFLAKTFRVPQLFSTGWTRQVLLDMTTPA